MDSPREANGLDDARIQTFLATKDVVVLATVQADGSPLAMAMWFLHDPAALIMISVAETQKVRNLRRDPRVSVVAEAVVAACAPVLSKCNQASLGQAAPGGEELALSLTTGQPTNPLAEHSAFAQGRALFYVVQARAGRCKAPPVKNGVPEGL